MEQKNVMIDGQEYVPYVPGLEPQPEQKPGEPFWSFLKSPQFWMIGVASCSTVLLREDFATLPWNQVVGQILSLWGAGSASFGLMNKVSKNVAGK